MNNPFFTIGHSTRTIDEFVRLLQSSQVTQLVDVRKIPRSRANPQYDQEVLQDSLRDYQIAYHHMAGLGGLKGKQGKSTSSEVGFWRNRSFQNYADYTRTPEFRSCLDQLTDVGSMSVCAVMCAEVLWWRCHRRIIADHLLARGESVLHILGEQAPVKATLTLGAKVIDGSVAYPDRPDC